jgi:hypothetical protein
MRVPADALILGDQHRSAVPRRRHEDLVDRIAVKWLWEFAALNENRARQLPDAESRASNGGIKPLVERAVENEVFLSTFLATSQTEMSEIHRSCFERLVAILDPARAQSRRSSVTHQTQAWVSKSVGIGIPSCTC